MKSPYKLDEFLGLEYFITDTKGIGGKLRVFVKDFYVEELPLDNYEEGEDYLHFILEKTNWDTLQAIKVIAKALRVSHKRLCFAGTKDKRAVTRQRVAVWKINEEQLRKVRIKDINIYIIGRGGRIYLGDAKGNKFRVVVREIITENFQEIFKTREELLERGIPNYFGYQRFGTTRPNTHLVGKEIIRGNLGEAVLAYLGKPFETESKEAYEARKILEESHNYKKALDIFPKNLRYERAMLNHLVKNPNDYAGALRRLPLKLRRMLVHAYQSYLFNKTLSKIIAMREEIKGKKIPLIGYETDLGEIEKEILEKEEVEKENFKIKSMPELTLKGLDRDACIETDIKVEPLDENACVFEFSLPKGSYATVVSREFMKTEPLDY